MHYEKPKLLVILPFITLLSATAFAATLPKITTLQQAVAYAHKTNPDYLASQDQYQYALKNVRVARAGYFPKVDADFGYGREATDSPTLRDQGKTGYTYMNRRVSGVALSQLIYDGGDVANQVEQAHKNADQSFNDVQTQGQLLTVNAVSAYLAVQRFRQLVTIYERNLQIHKQILKRAERKLSGRATRKSEVTLAQSRVAQAEAGVVNVKRNLQDAINNFIQVVGVRPGHYMHSAGMPKIPLPRTLVKAEATALQKNPELKAAVDRLQAAWAQVGQAKSKFFPELEFDATATRNLDVGGTKGTNNNNTVMLNVVYNLYNGGGDIASYAASKENYYRQIELKESVLRQMLDQLRNAWITFQATKNTIPQLELSVQQEKQTVILYDQEYKIGSRSLILRNFNVSIGKNTTN